MKLRRIYKLIALLGGLLCLLAAIVPSVPSLKPFSAPVTAGGAFGLGLAAWSVSEYNKSLKGVQAYSPVSGWLKRAPFHVAFIIATLAVITACAFWSRG